MKRTLAVSSANVTIILLGGYLISFGKEAVIASFMGVSSISDAYAVAIQVPVTLFAFFAVSINSIIIPLYLDIKQNSGIDKANLFVSNFINILTVVSLFIVFIGEVFAGQIIYLFAPGFNSDTHSLATFLLRLTIPSVSFTGIIQVLTSILNANRVFNLPSLGPYFLNIILILTIVSMFSFLGVSSACIGQFVGSFVQMIFIIRISKKYFNWSFEFTFNDENLRKAGSMSLPVAWGISVSEVNTIVNRMVASYLFVGSISALSYASKLSTVFMSLFVSALSTIVYPLYSDSIAKVNYSKLNYLINFTLSSFSFVLIPLVILMISFGNELVTLVFSRGRFDTIAVNQTQELFIFFSAGIIFLSFRQTLTNVFYALKDTKTPALNASLGVFINICLNLTLPYLFGLKGLAISSTITAAFISIRLVYILHSRFDYIVLADFFQSIWKILLSGSIMVIFIIFFKSELFFDLNNLGIILLVIFSCFLYLILNIIFRTKVTRDIFNTIKIPVISKYYD